MLRGFGVLSSPRASVSHRTYTTKAKTTSKVASSKKLQTSKPKKTTKQKPTKITELKATAKPTTVVKAKKTTDDSTGEHKKVKKRTKKEREIPGRAFLSPADDDMDLEFEELAEKDLTDEYEKIPDIDDFAANFYSKPKKSKSEPGFEVPKMPKTPIEIEAENLESPKKRVVREFPYVNIVKKNADGRTSHFLIGTTVPYGKIEVEGEDGQDVKHVVEVQNEEEWDKIMKQHDEANAKYSANSGRDFVPKNMRNFNPEDGDEQDLVPPKRSAMSPNAILKKATVVDEDGDEDDLESDDFSGRKKKVYVPGNYDIKLVVDVIKELKGWDIVALDCSNKANFIPFMVFATGRSGTHLRGMAERLVKELKSRRKGSFKIDHKDNDFWMIVNSGDILVNLFTEPERSDYDLERVWVLRREQNPFKADTKEETKFIYDDDDGIEDDDDVSVIEHLLDE